jgi:four helix bundle protein
MREYGFERLVVWQNARKLTVEIYRCTKVFPTSEKYGITAQIRRAAVSVASNIAEGSSRRTIKDQQHFYRMAYSSLMELLNQLIISTDLGFIKEEEVNALRLDIEKISSALYTLKGKK